MGERRPPFQAIFPTKPRKMNMIKGDWRTEQDKRDNIYIIEVKR
jgi:hypothetical protein